MTEAVESDSEATVFCPLAKPPRQGEARRGKARERGVQGVVRLLILGEILAKMVT